MGRYDPTNRYIVHVKNGTPVKEHRQVWIDHHGEIPPGYIIHHKNRNRSDNRIDNLEMMTPKEHLLEHQIDRGGPAKYQAALCSWCGKIFIRLESRFKQYPGRKPYCSNKCVNGQKELVTRQCTVCGKAFQRAEKVFRLGPKRSDRAVCGNPCRRDPRNTSGFRGVSFNKKHRKFQAKIQADGVLEWIGHFDSAEEAAKAYDAVALQLHGQSACVNFPPPAASPDEREEQT